MGTPRAGPAFLDQAGHIVPVGTAEVEKRTSGSSSLAFVRYVLIASGVLWLEVIIIGLTGSSGTSGCHNPVTLENVVGTTLLIGSLTLALAAASSAIPFSLMVVITRRFRIDRARYCGLAGCLMTALTAVPLAFVFSGGLMSEPISPFWVQLYGMSGILLLPVVTATLAYWWFDVCKPGSRR